MALNECNTVVAADLVKNCINPIIKGVESRAVIANASDVVFQLAATGDYVSTISATEWYKVSNVSNLTTTKVDGAHVNVFEKVISGVLLDDGEYVQETIEALGSKHGEFVMIIEHKFKDIQSFPSAPSGSSAYEIIGLEVPLNATGQEIVNDKNSDDTRGGWAFSLSTQEVHPRYYWQVLGSWTSTENAFNAMYNG